MDPRVRLSGLLGREDSDVYVIRNAGGVVTDDVIRSLVISQRLRGTRDVVLVQHTDCGMLTFTDAGLARAIEEEVGIRPPFAFEAFTDLAASVRRSVARVRASPFLVDTRSVLGFVYEVETGRLREVT
jgi:carbonic anhydrase